jgi:D-alanyl-D-alanine carboxypeptidase
VFRYDGCAMILRNIALLALALLLLPAAPKPGWAATVQTKAPYVFLIDDNTGAVLFAKKSRRADGAGVDH